MEKSDDLFVEEQKTFFKTCGIGAKMLKQKKTSTASADVRSSPCTKCSKVATTTALGATAQRIHWTTGRSQCWAKVFRFRPWRPTWPVGFAEPTKMPVLFGSYESYPPSVWCLDPQFCLERFFGASCMLATVIVYNLRVVVCSSCVFCSQFAACFEHSGHDEEKKWTN